MAESKPAQKPAATFDWADLPEEETVEQGYVRGTRIDVEKEIPAPIREKVEKNLSEYLAQEKNEHGVYPGPIWRRQPCGTEERADQFIKMVKRYGQYRKAGQLTIRATLDAKDKTKVRYCVKPKESKTTNRLPGSESKDGPKTPPAEKPGEKKVDMSKDHAAVRGTHHTGSRK